MHVKKQLLLIAVVKLFRASHGFVRVDVDSFIWEWRLRPKEVCERLGVSYYWLIHAPTRALEQLQGLASPMQASTPFKTSLGPCNPVSTLQLETYLARVL